MVPGLAERTAGKIGTTFNWIECILPRVANGKLSDLNAEAVSRFQAALRAGTRSENTIASYLAHLRACAGVGSRPRDDPRGAKDQAAPASQDRLRRLQGQGPTYYRRGV